MTIQEPPTQPVIYKFGPARDVADEVRAFLADRLKVMLREQGARQQEGEDGRQPGQVGLRDRAVEAERQPAVAGVPELEDIAGQAFHGKVFVHGADDVPLRLQDHRVVARVGNGPAGGQRGHARAQVFEPGHQTGAHARQERLHGGAVLRHAVFGDVVGVRFVTEQVRGLPLVGVSLILGSPWLRDPTNTNSYLADPTARLHLYGKAETRAGRKMGHVTRIEE